MAAVLPPRLLLARLASPACFGRSRSVAASTHVARWAPVAKPASFSTLPSRLSSAPDPPTSTTSRTARGVTKARPPEQRAAVRVEQATLISEGEVAPALEPARDDDGGRPSRAGAAVDADADDTSSAQDASSSDSRSSEGGTPSSSPVSLSDKQDPELGHLTSTSSHLLRLTLPLPSPSQPVSFVLHPAQPLSYLSRLIATELPASLPDVALVQYRGFGEEGRWSEATDLSDFLRQSANIKAFTIDLLPASRPPSSLSSADDESSKAAAKEFPEPLKSIKVMVPSFLSRTQYLRQRLDAINGQLQQMAATKAECDSLAKQGARRVALGGLAGLLAYWAAVAAATLRWGWDIMEPVTYLIGHGVIVGGYCYWLHHQKQPDYHTVLTRTISSRQARLYAEKGFDYDRHQRLIAAGRQVREEIGKIAGEYGVEWDSAPSASSSQAQEVDEGGMSRGKREVHSALKQSEKLERRSKVKTSLRQDEGKEEEEEDDDDDDDHDRPRGKGKDVEKDMLRKEWKRLEKSKGEKDCMRR